MVRRTRNRSNWGANIKMPYQQRIEREAAQATYVREWREAHPSWMVADPWRCPLCNYTVQESVAQAEIRLPGLIEDHKFQHGQDWERYAALAADRGRADAP